jgi:hypothetical protein
MKKNLGKLIVEVGKAAMPKKLTPFKITCQNAHEFTNKILVDAEEYNKPSSAKLFI